MNVNQKKSKNPLVAAVDGLYNRFGTKEPENTSETGKSTSINFELYSPELYNRRKVYKEYEQLATNQYVNQAKKVYADHLISGGSEGNDSSSWTAEVEEGPATVTEMFEELEETSGIKNLAWEFAYQLVGDGDSFWEPIIANIGSRKIITALNHLPVDTINRVVDARKRVVDPEKAYVQINKDSGQEIAAFSIWQLLHFNAANRNENPYFPDAQYGFKRSILWSAREPYNKWKFSSASAYFMRMQSARQVRKFIHDTTGMSQLEAEEFKKKAKINRTQSIMSDPTTGRLDAESYFSKTFVEDIDIAVSADYPKADVSNLAGDSNLGNIEDVKFFRDEFILSLETPKHLMNFTEDFRMKAVAGSLDVAFARNVKRYSGCMGAALKQFYRLGLMLNNIDPSNVKFNIKFALQGMVNELVIAQVNKLKAETVKIYAYDVGLHIGWVLENILDIPANDVEDLIKKSFGSGVVNQIKDVKNGNGTERLKDQLLDEFMRNENMTGILDNISSLLEIPN